MARYAIIENGTVANIVEAEADFAGEQGWIAAGSAQIGWSYDGQDFSAPVLTLEQAKEAKRSAIERKRDEVMSAGFTPSTGPVAGKTLQTRGDDDKINWLTSQAAYQAAVAGGAGDVADATFRTADNETVVATYAEGLETLLGMAAWGKAIWGNSWALKDAVSGASDMTELSAIDIEEGWP